MTLLKLSDKIINWQESRTVPGVPENGISWHVFSGLAKFRRKDYV
jgi:hypothetical protein